jgi:tetratricopeptide (TPR) repeat protein
MTPKTDRSMSMATSKPEQGARPNVGWFGSLANVPLAEVFRRIAAEELSGDLQVHLGSAIKSVYFDHGFVVFAASNLKRDRLGESMIDAGRISRHEFALASMIMKGSRRKFGEALVQAGVLSEEDLGREVAMQVNRIVLSLFKSKDGIYSFDERGTSIPVELMVSLSIYRILLEGVRFMTDGKLILAGLPPLNTSVKVADRPPFTVEPRKLKAVEQELLKGARTPTPLASLLQDAEADRGLALRASYGLWAAGLLESAGETTKPPLKVQEETGVFVLSEIQRKFAKIRATNARQEILMEFDKLDRTPEPELLAVAGLSRETDLEQAFEKRRLEWEEKRAMVENERTLAAKIDVIQERLRQAYDRLRSGPPEEASEETTAAEDAPEIFEAAEETLPPLNEELFDEIGIEDMMGSGELATPVENDENDENHENADSGIEPTTDAEDAVSERVEAVEAPPPRSEKPSTALYGAARVERVRQLLRDVKLHFQVRDWEHAVSLLYELVELEPESAQHHAMLARAMARHPVMRKDAERHFIEALRLAPQDADLHFSLGLYYKSFGMHSRAQHEFRTAIRINPNHEDAKKHISSGRNAKDPLRDVFKKIFG